MAYGTVEDVMVILPNASGIIDDSAYSGSPETLITACQAYAYAWVNSVLRPYTKVPNTSITALTLAEAQYSGYLILQGTSAIGDDSTLAYADRYRKEAKKLLDEAEFDASYTAATLVAGNTGNGTMTITVSNEFTPSASWEARYQGSDVWTIWNSKDGGLGTYNTSSDTTFPNPSTDSLNTQEAVKSILIAITAGAVAFAKNDMFRWKTFSSTRKRSGIKFRRLGTG